MRRLMRGMKFEVCFLTFQRLLIRSGHEGLIFKLKQNEISAKLLGSIKDFLSDRKNRVVLNGRCSSPQDSVLGLLFFYLS